MRSYRLSRFFMSLLMMMSLTGCATMLSGTSAEVKIQSAPKNANFIIVSGKVGKLLIMGKKKSELIQRVLKHLKPHLDKKTYRIVRKADLVELMTALIVYAKLDHVPDFVSGDLSGVLNKVPRRVIRSALSSVGIGAMGRAPKRVRLDLGSDYVVIGHAKGHKVDIEEIKTSFNGFVFLNIFNLGIGALIDLATGAYKEIDSTRVKLVMKPRR